MSAKERQVLLLLAIASDEGSQDPGLYHDLAGTLPSSSANDTVALPNGTDATKLDLYVKVIALGGRHPDTYHNLAVTLPGSADTVKLPDGTVCTKKDLYRKAIELGGAAPGTYHNLALALDRDERITLSPPSSTAGDAGATTTSTLGRRDLWLKAIELGSDDPNTFTNLGAVLAAGATVTLPDGTVATKRDLHVKAIALGSDEWTTFHNLALTMGSPTDSVALPGNTEPLSANDVWLKAIALGAQDPAAYVAVAASLKRNGDTVTIPAAGGGATWSKKKLVARALELQGTDVRSAYGHRKSTKSSC
jgi:hypothetical protein